MQQGQFDEALARYRELHVRHPPNQSLPAHIAKIYLKQDEPLDAVVTLICDRVHFGQRSTTANCFVYDLLSRPDLDLSELPRVRQNSPDANTTETDFFNDLGDTFLEINRFQQAGWACELALQSARNQPDIYLKLADFIEIWAQIIRQLGTDKLCT